MDKLQIKDITKLLENIAPLALQESYDNSGLLVGSENQHVNGALISLDITEAIIDEAIAENCNLIIAHHPIIFGGLKKLNGSNYIERCVIKAIKNDIAIYAIHTNLDNIWAGVNAKIAEKLNLKNTRILSPKADVLKKLVTFCPMAALEQVRTALFSAGAGAIGAYDECSFTSDGTGSFRASADANPFVGKINERHYENETKLELVYPSYLEKAILQALIASHPYEEVAYDLLVMTNKHKQIGSGLIGELETGQEEIEFLKQLKTNFNVSCIRHTNLLGNKVKKVALCGG